MAKKIEFQMGFLQFVLSIFGTIGAILSAVFIFYRAILDESKEKVNESTVRLEKRLDKLDLSVENLSSNMVQVMTKLDVEPLKVSSNGAQTYAVTP